MDLCHVDLDEQQTCATFDIAKQIKDMFLRNTGWVNFVNKQITIKRCYHEGHSHCKRTMYFEIYRQVSNISALW